MDDKIQNMDIYYYKKGHSKKKKKKYQEEVDNIHKNNFIAWTIFLKDIKKFGWNPRKIQYIKTKFSYLQNNKNPFNVLPLVWKTICIVYLGISVFVFYLLLGIMNGGYDLGKEW